MKQPPSQCSSASKTGDSVIRRLAFVRQWVFRQSSLYSGEAYGESMGTFDFRLASDVDNLPGSLGAGE